MKALILDVVKCTGCRNCEIYCTVEQSISKTLFRAIFEERRPNRYVFVQYAEGQPVPMQCMHCENPPCATICPTRAIEKMPDGSVQVSGERCIGCKYCVYVCPFGAMYIDIARKMVVKCDLCRSRIEKGLVPRCVESCPTGALKYGEVDEFIKERKASVALGILSAIRRGEVVIGGVPS